MPNTRPASRPAASLALEHARASRGEQEGRADRAVAVLARHEHDPRERREDPGEAADARAVRVDPRCSSRSRRLRQQPGEQREEQDQRDHPEHDPDRGAGRADLQQLGLRSGRSRLRLRR